MKPVFKLREGKQKRAAIDRYFTGIQLDELKSYFAEFAFECDSTRLNFDLSGRRLVK